MITTQTLTNIRSKPAWYVQEVLGYGLWSYQRKIMDAVASGREVAIKSCHGVGKSYTGGKLVAWYLPAFPGSIVWTTAPTSRQVYNILWREIRATVKNAKVYLGGEVLKTRWELNEQHYAYGFATDSGDAFQGTHAISGHILGIVDEASGVADAIFEAAEGTLTSDDAKLVMFGNPTIRSGYFYNAFKRKGVIKITISCFDTPNFIANNIRNVEDLLNADIENLNIVAPYLITPRWALSILEKYGEKSTNFMVRCLGEFPDGADDTLVAIDWIEQALGRPVKIAKSDTVVISCDPARYGSDRTVIIVRKGLAVLEKIVITKHSTTDIAGRLIKMRRERPGAKVKIDVIGLGAGIYDMVLEAFAGDAADDILPVNAAASAIQSEEYGNMRMEMWWNMRQAFRDGLSLPKGDEDFLEIAEPKYKFNSKGQMMLESKDEIKKRLGKSPDVGDALAISFAEVDKSEAGTVFVGDQ